MFKTEGSLAAPQASAASELCQGTNRAPRARGQRGGFTEGGGRRRAGAKRLKMSSSSRPEDEGPLSRGRVTRTGKMDRVVTLQELGHQKRAGEQAKEGAKMEEGAEPESGRLSVDRWSGRWWWVTVMGGFAPSGSESGYRDPWGWSIGNVIT
ncbi:hypothetical protein BJV78DRAFT_1153941 [Lactifluus subvellereus]|nr:hypothetical protein BJV78DRAFT_1153941 [Lactifluus subvellereus]